MNTYSVIDVMLSIPPIYTHPEGFDALPRGACRFAASHLGHSPVIFASGWGSLDKNHNPMWKGRMVMDGNAPIVADVIARIKHYLQLSMQKNGYTVCECSITTKLVEADTHGHVDGLDSVG
jgi:hypothetical protein